MKPYHSISPLVFPPLFRLASHDGDTYEQRGPGGDAPRTAAAVDEARNLAGYWLGFFFVAAILVTAIAARGGVH